MYTHVIHTLDRQMYIKKKRKYFYKLTHSDHISVQITDQAIFFKFNLNDSAIIEERLTPRNPLCLILIIKDALQSSRLRPLEVAKGLTNIKN